MVTKRVRVKGITLHNTCLHPLLITQVLHLIFRLHHHIRSGMHTHLHPQLVYRYYLNYFSTPKLIFVNYKFLSGQQQFYDIYF